MQLLHDIPQKASALVQATSTGTGDVQTVTPPSGPQPRAFKLCFETTDARVTFNGTAPASNNGLLYPKAQTPSYEPFSAPIKFASTAGANCIANVHWLY